MRICDLIFFLSYTACHVKWGSLCPSCSTHPPQCGVAGILCGCICSGITLLFCSQYHSFQSCLLIILGLSDACEQIPIEVRIVLCSLWNPIYIYMKSLLHFVQRERFLKVPLEWLIRNLLFSRQDPSLTFYCKTTHNYQLLNICCLQQAHLYLFLLILTSPLVSFNKCC